MERYAPTYRQDELDHICRLVLRGVSLCLVGLAGAGKTNLTNLLCQDPYRYKAKYLAKMTDQVHFVLLDIPTWEGQAEHLWQMMLRELMAATMALGAPTAPESRIRPMAEGANTLAQLRDHVSWLCQERDQHVVFLFDDVDRALERGPLPMLEQLYNLRNRGNKGRLSFILFTKRLPGVLGRRYDLAGKSKFYNLISDHTYALGLYSPSDALQMVNYLNHGAGDALHHRDMIAILRLSGRHAGLIKVLFESWMRQPPDAVDASAIYRQNSDIERMCLRIYRGLHSHEQAAAWRAANQQCTPDDAEVIRLLAVRNLVAESQPLVWFSPLFHEFLRRR